MKFSAIEQNEELMRKIREWASMLGDVECLDEIDEIVEDMYETLGE